MNPRGVTLVELLAAISILVVVTALALPALQNRLGAARFDAAQGQLQAAALATRAEAMRQGKSLSLTAHLSPSGEVELLMVPLKRSDGQAGTGSNTGGEIDDRGATSGSRWVVLPGSIRINADPPSPPDAPEHATKNSASEARDVRLAVFCPDGSAVTSPAYLSDGESVVVVTVNPWIGGVKFAAFVAAGPDASATGQGDGRFADGSGERVSPERAAAESGSPPPTPGGIR